MAHVIADLYPLIRLEAPGLPEPILQQEVQDVIDEFLAQTEVWKHTCPNLLDWETAQVFPTLVVGTDIPSGTRVVRFDTVKYASDGTSLREIPFRTRQDLDGTYSDWEVKTGSSPLSWTMDGLGDTPRIVPIATADVLGSLQLRVVLGTDRAISVIPEFFLHEFGEAIRFGVLGRVLAIPDKDWTNMGKGVQYQGLYDMELNKAKSRGQAGFGQPNQRIMAYGGI